MIHAQDATAIKDVAKPLLACLTTGGAARKSPPEFRQAFKPHREYWFGIHRCRAVVLIASSNVFLTCRLASGGLEP